MAKNLLVEELKKKLTSFEDEITQENVGHVVSIGDGIVKAVGLSDVQSQEMVEFESGELGLALNLEEDSVGVMVLGSGLTIKEGDQVKATGKLIEVPAGKELLGRVVNALGKPIDGKGAINAEKSIAIEQEARGVIERESVNEPLYTGVKAIDAMTPIGRGQRELIIGDHNQVIVYGAQRYVPPRNVRDIPLRGIVILNEIAPPKLPG